MIYLIQVSNSQLIPSFLAILRHSQKLEPASNILILLYPAFCREYFDEHAAAFCATHGFRYILIPRPPSLFSRIINIFFVFFPFQTRIISVCQSSYAKLTIVLPRCRKTIFTGDGFGIKSVCPMNHGRINSVSFRQYQPAQYLYTPLFRSTSLETQGICNEVKLYKFISRRNLNKLFLFGQYLFERHHLKTLLSKQFSKIFVFAPSNFSENLRLTLYSEVTLYLEDIKLLLSGCDRQNTLLVIKPHPYGSPKKTYLLLSTLCRAFPSLDILLEPTRMPVEQYIYLFDDFLKRALIPSSLTLLSYQTSWPTIISLGFDINVRVGFAGDAYLDLFASHSVEQRFLFQESIPSSLRLS